MFGNFFKAFRGQSVEPSSSGSQTNTLGQLTIFKEKWAYKDLFTSTPERFYTNIGNFIENVNLGFSQAKWTHHLLNDQFSAYILAFDPSKPRLTDSKVLMAAAIYRPATNTPLEFYVLIDIPMGIRIRQVDEKLTSWAARDGLDPVTCIPDLDSFVDFLQTRIAKNL